MANSNGWGDGAANNAIGWGQGANNAIAWGDSHAKSWAGATDIVGIDSSAAAFISATGITGATQQAAIDNLVKGLKADGLWSKMKAVYPFVTDNRNLLGYTEDFGNAYWYKQDGTVTSNTIAAPNGTTTADSFFEAANTTTHGIQKGFTLSTTSAHTYSAYVKQLNGREGVAIRFGSSNSDSTIGTYIGSIFFTYSTQVISGDLSSSAQVEILSNGWYRLSVTVTPPTTSLNVSLWSSNGSTVTFAGDVTKGFYIWGAQLELGSTATTYQPIATTQQAFIASQFKFNLVNPVDSDAAFRLVFNGGWTHSSNGATPNGTNGYADTKLVPSSVLTTSTLAHLSYYSRTDSAVNFEYVMGSINTGTGGLGMIARRDTNNRTFVADFPSGTSFRVASDNNSTNGSGYFVGTQQGANAKLFRNNSLAVSNSIAANNTAITSLPIFIGAFNFQGSPNGFFTNKQCAFSTIGDGLTDTEAANLYTRVQAYQTALSRQV